VLIAPENRQQSENSKNYLNERMGATAASMMLENKKFLRQRIDNKKRDASFSERFRKKSRIHQSHNLNRPAQGPLVI
jgi:hypothetical protein